MVTIMRQRILKSAEPGRSTPLCRALRAAGRGGREMGANRLVLKEILATESSGSRDSSGGSRARKRYGSLPQRVGYACAEGAVGRSLHVVTKYRTGVLYVGC